MFDTRLRKNLDIPLLALTYGLALLGLLIIYSATHGDATAFHKKQFVWMVIGTVGLITAASIDYHVYARFAKHLYILNLVLLGLVLMPRFHNRINGAARWIKIAGFPFQPSELAKLIVIITLGVFLTHRAATIREPKTFVQSFLYVVLPILMIFKQPDLGTALVVVSIWVGMVFIAGARLKHIAAFFGCGTLLFAVIWFSGKGISNYQRQRLITVFNPQATSQKGGYQVTQARIAIGSGGLWGKGYLHGTQVQGGYMPEKQTDFIFTNIGEELGFVGSVFITCLYGLLLLRASQVITTSDEDQLGKLIATGIVTMLTFHVFVNIGMNVGIMPVAGVPLPLISYGGTNLIMVLTCIGLLLSISRHRHQLLF